MNPPRLTTLLTGICLLAACKSTPEKQVRQGQNGAVATDTAAQPLPAVQARGADILVFSEITPFTPNETNTLFTAPGGWEATSFETGDKITLQKDGQTIGSINCSSHPYNGPGFALYHYAPSVGSGRSVLLVEAQADPGTAWYCAALIDNNRIVKQVFIDDPGAIQKYMSSAII